MPDHSKTHPTDAQFKKLQRAADGKMAMSEYEAEAAAMRTKTEKLRALRLAREAANVAAAPVTAVPAKKKTSKKKSAAVPLSDWIKTQQDSGRNN